VLDTVYFLILVGHQRNCYLNPVFLKIADYAQKVCNLFWTLPTQKATTQTLCANLAQICYSWRKKPLSDKKINNPPRHGYNECVYFTFLLTIEVLSSYYVRNSTIYFAVYKNKHNQKI
jgi:hypothetical protein